MPDSWPISLPQGFLVEGAVDSMPDGRMRTKTDTGPGKVRRRSTAMPRLFQGEMLMTATQLADMQTFINTNLGGGVLPFLINDPNTDTPALVRFGESLPAWTFLGVKYRVALSLEFLP